MGLHISTPAREAIVYPDSDGQPMADNTLQWEWIATIEGGLEAVFRDDPNVFVAGDLLWYPVEGDPTIRTASDVMVALGRPKGYRGSYLQWREDNIPPQVVFAVLSPGNRFGEMFRKFKFYERYGAEEYYLDNPDTDDLEGWLRRGGELHEIPEMSGWTSPRLGVRFDTGGELKLYGPDGRRFASYVELAQQRDELARQRDEMARQRDELERQRELERRRADRLEAQLRAMGAEPGA